MEYVLLGIVIFLFVLAVLDLSEGVSNDASNFLNSSVGAKAAPFSVILIIAAAGIFIGAIASNGMIEVVRTGIFHPEGFSFFDVLCIFLAVMVTDVILLNIFNALGMPTSTTVSMVFELLGASFAISIFRISADSSTSLAQLLNSEKAFEVIIAIFLSVGIAFIFGCVVQYLARLWFTFNYKRGGYWKMGVFGGLCATGIIYFLLFKGMKEMTFMTPEVKEWIDANTLLLIIGCFAACTVIMQALHMLKVNVLKVVVLLGTFALAMAFAGNDLVNFIGVPVTGFSAYRDYIADGGGDMQGHMMTALAKPESIPLYFLVTAGVIMIVSLVFSKKAKRVVDTSVNLAHQEVGDETFGTSGVAKASVRKAITLSRWIVRHTPRKVRIWIARRMDTNEAILEKGAAFDLVRGSINLVLAGMLIALGTSLKLPLSTTYVTFMVAMGTSLSDRAWGRESAVFRITGVLSVVGGWFITAGAAFVGTALIAALMHVGGLTAIAITSIIAIGLVINKNLAKHVGEEGASENMVQKIITSTDKTEAWTLLKKFMVEKQLTELEFAREAYSTIVNGFVNDTPKQISKTVTQLRRSRDRLKAQRSKLTLCFRHIDPALAIELSTWYHLAMNCQIEIFYNLMRIANTCDEHVGNNFVPLPKKYVAEVTSLATQVEELLAKATQAITAPEQEEIINLRQQCSDARSLLSDTTRKNYERIRQGDNKNVDVMYIYINLLQESQEILSNLRKFLRADAKMLISPETQIRKSNN